MLHLGDASQKTGRPTFSLYIPRVANDAKFNQHNEFLGLTIEKIRALVEAEGGVFSGVIGAGHSKGAILIAHRFFADSDDRIKSICAINGRLKVPREEDCSHNDLKMIVKRVYQGILKHPEKPLTQIVAKDDWNASRESMAVRPQERCYIVPGMHLSGLYTDATRAHFSDFLNNPT
jgi:hypothetical protein